MLLLLSVAAPLDVVLRSPAARGAELLKDELRGNKYALNRWDPDPTFYEWVVLMKSLVLIATSLAA